MTFHYDIDTKAVLPRDPLLARNIHELSLKFLTFQGRIFESKHSITNKLLSHEFTMAFTVSIPSNTDPKRRMNINSTQIFLLLIYGFSLLVLFVVSIMCFQGRHVGEHYGLLHGYIFASLVSEFSLFVLKPGKRICQALTIFMTTWGCVMAINLFDSLSHTLPWKTCVATVGFYVIDFVCNMSGLTFDFKQKEILKKDD